MIPFLKYKLSQFANPYPYRRYTRKYKCIFIHIPKTAGTSILLKFVNKRISRDHCSYFEYLMADMYRFKKYYKFCFVRNPYDRLVSVYHYFARGGNGSPGDLYYSNIIKKEQMDFSSFVSIYINEYTIHEHLLLKPQYLFIYDHTGRLMVDYVGYFENLDTDFSTIAKKLGISGALEKTNVSPRDSWVKYYTNITIADKVFLLYKKDFEIFKYHK